MSEPSADIRIERLLAHQEWVRGLARRLVADETRADDVVQEVYAGALRRPPRHARSIRSWLAAVTRNAARRLGRSERRRAHYESGVPVSRVAEPTADVAGRAELHRRVVDAVIGLPEPLRGAVLLRYFDGLSLSETAARMGAPFETARKRIARGLALLRQRLAEEDGRPGRALAVLLLPLLERPRGGVLTSTAAGVLMTLTKTKITILITAALLLYLGISAVPGDRPGPESLDSGASPALRVAAAGEEAAEEPVVAIDVRALLDRSIGALALDDLPLSRALGEVSARTGIRLCLTASAVREIDEQRIRVALQTFKPVPARKLLDLVGTVCSLAWEQDGSRVVFRLKAGRRDPDEVLVEVPGQAPDPDAPRQLVVRGRVLDSSGAAVPGAQVFAVAPRSTRDLGTAGEDGEFEFSFARPWPRLVARAPGHCDSLAAPLQGKPGERIRIDLALRGTAARVEGTVRDQEGRPVAKAVVRAGGEKHPRWPAVVPIGPPSIAVRTDPEGRFACDSVPPGTRAIRAARHEYLETVREITVDAGATTSVDLVLTTGTVVTGVVRDEEGRAVPGAVITARMPGGELFGIAKSDDGGRYRISGLPDFPLAVVVEDGTGARTSERFTRGAGPDIVYDPILMRGLTISGRVVDEQGLPLPGYRVETLVEKLSGPMGSADDRTPVSTTTDDEGRFALGGVSEGMNRVCAHPPTQRIPLVVAEVHAGGEQELRIMEASRPSCHVDLSVLGPGGKPLPKVQVRLIDRKSGKEVSVTTDENGRIDLPLVPAGNYDLVLRSFTIGLRRLSRLTLDPGARRDFGPVRYPAPAVLTFVRPEDGDTAPRWVIVDEILSDGSREKVWSCYPRAGEVIEKRLAPGRYAVRLLGPGLMGEEHRLDLASGGEESLAVKLAPAAERRLRLVLEKEIAPRAALLDVRNARGEIVFRALTERKPRAGPLEEARAPLVPGTYEVLVRAAGGRELRTTLVIPDDADPDVRYDLAPR